MEIDELRQFFHRDVPRLIVLGDEVKRRFGQPIARMAGAGETILLPFDQEVEVNHVILMEEMRMVNAFIPMYWKRSRLASGWSWYVEALLDIRGSIESRQSVLTGCGFGSCNKGLPSFDLAIPSYFKPTIAELCIYLIN